MSKSETKFILISFIIWRLGLFAVLFLATKFITPQNNFLGGGYETYLKNPLFWAWGNFDGQRYTTIAQNGYMFGEYTFFPFYPILIKYLGNLLGNNLPSLFLAGNIISNISFLIALFGFYKLARLDLTSEVSKISLILLLLFPTSFYFASVYTESLFFALLVWCFYLIRKDKFFAAGLLGILLTTTRSIGIFIFPVMIIEWFVKNNGKKLSFKNFPFSSFLPTFGLLGYMYYLKNKLGDPLAFFSQQTNVGEHRSNHIILIPQIIYRYIFKIFPNLNFSYFPGTFSVIFEFAISLLFLAVVFGLFLTTRISYAVFALGAYLVPTFLGSFSSMPRYVLIIFPFYFVAAKYLSRSKKACFAFYLISSILLVVSFSLFARGYWIS